MRNKPSPVILNFNIREEKKQEEDIQFYEAMKKAHKGAMKAFVAFLDDIENIDKKTRVEQCAKFLTFKEYPEININKLHSINLCRERLCLNCQLANSRKLIRQLIFAVEHLKLEEGDTLQFLTLTRPNVKKEQIRASVQDLYKASKNFLRKFKIKDYFRSTEITFNEKEETYHPHLHILLVCPKSSKLPLFDKKLGKNGCRYLEEEWAKEHNKISGREDKYLMATIYEVRDKKSIFELTKYITKPKDIKKDVISAFYGNKTGISGLRLKTPCGQFKTLKKKYDIITEMSAQMEEQALDGLDYELITYVYNDENYRYERMG